MTLKKNKQVSIITKKKKIFLYWWTTKNFIIINKTKTQQNFWIDTETSEINFENKNKTIMQKINDIIYKQWLLLFTKLKFNGKGYKIKKTKKKTVLLLFNFSHKSYIYLKKIILKKIGKNKMLLLSNNNVLTQKYTNMCLKLRNNNIYTKRGLRNARSIIRKKNGKKTNN